MTTAPIPGSSPTDAPILHGRNPREALLPGDFGLETVEDVAHERGLWEDAWKIVDILMSQPRYMTSEASKQGVWIKESPTPEEVVAREKNRLAYEKLKELWEKIGKEDDKKLIALKKNVTDIEATMAYWRSQDRPEKANALQQQLEDAQRAVNEYQSAGLSEAQKAQLIAYGKKRLAQLAMIADYLENWGRKERMGGMITRLEGEKELLWREIGAKEQKKQELQAALDQENEKWEDRNQVLIVGLEEEILTLKNEIANLDSQVVLVRDEEESIERSIKADGMRGTHQSQNITLADIGAQRDETVSKLKMLGVPEHAIHEFVVVSQPGERDAGLQEQNVQLLGTETGEAVTEMTQVLPGRAWKHTHIKKITSLSAPDIYVIELDTGEKYKKRQLLVKAKPWHTVEVLSWGDTSSASEVSIRTVGETKLIVCEETQETGSAGAPHTNTYRMYNEHTGEQLGQEARIDGYMRFERELLEGFDYITEIEYGAGVDMRKWLINLATGTVIIDKEEGGINRRYDLLSSDKKSIEWRRISERFAKHENLIGNIDALIACLQQKYYVLVQADGCLCLIDKSTNKKIGYVTPKSSRWYTEQQGYMTMVYPNSAWNNMSDGSIDVSAAWTYMTLPGEKVLQEQVSRWPSLGNFAETLGIGKEYALLQRESDKMRIVLKYATLQAQELWSGDIKLDFPRDLLCIGDGDDIDKLYYIRQEENGSHTIDGVYQTNDLHRLRLRWTNTESEVLLVWIPNPTSKSRQYYLYNKKTWWAWILYKSSKEEDVGARKTLRLYKWDGLFASLGASLGGADVTIVANGYRDIMEVKYK